MSHMLEGLLWDSRDVVKFVTSIRNLRVYNDRAEFLLPSRAEFKNEWIFTSTSPIFPHDVYRKLPYLYVYVEV